MEGRLQAMISRPYALLDSTFAGLSQQPSSGSGSSGSGSQIVAAPLEKVGNWMRGVKASFAAVLSNQEAISKVGAL